MTSRLIIKSELEVPEQEEDGEDGECGLKDFKSARVCVCV